MNRTLVIGDIHGGLRALHQIMERAKVSITDTLLFLGDYVVGWSQSPQVIDYLTDITGTPSHYYNYLPFGEEMVAQNNSSYNNVYRFSAKELDEDTGLSYFGARYYDPKFSIWLSIDPLAEKFPSWSPYTFCYNNPLRFIDPDGRESDDVIKFMNNGSVERTKTNDNFDVLTNESGDKTMQIDHKDGKSQIGEIQTIDLERKSGTNTVQYMTIENNDVARNVFEFAASTTTSNSSNAEFELSMFSFADGYSTNLFQTGEISATGLPNVTPLGQIGGIDLGNNHLIQNANWIEANHSHSGTQLLFPSGFSRYNKNGSPFFEPIGVMGDRVFEKGNHKVPNKQYLYGPNDKTYIEYNFNSAKIIGNRR